MTSLKSFVLVALLSFFSFAHADGMPVPWPFPWAEECEVNWQSMAGRYLLSESNKEEQIELVVHVVYTSQSQQEVYVSRYSQSGELLSSGHAPLTAEQRSLSLYLYPTSRQQVITRAVIELYYQTSQRSCEEDYLLPILTLEKVDGILPAAKTQYRLVKLK